jgi:hypothetical protein
LYVPEFHVHHSIAGRKDVKERIITIVGLLLRVGESSSAFSTRWDLELWMEKMDVA